MGKKVKVVFDTNVWLSIFMKKALSQDFSNIMRKEATVYVTEEILAEISRALQYPRIIDVTEASGIGSREILRAIAANSKMVEPKMKIHVVEDDPEDNKILEAAATSGAGIIVTGDKHLLKLGKFKKTRILTPREFLDSIS